jgi:hypothetical protein
LTRNGIKGLRVNALQLVLGNTIQNNAQPEALFKCAWHKQMPAITECQRKEAAIARNQ